MPLQLSTEQAIGQIRFRGAALAQQGRMDELREHFADCAAAAMMTEGYEALDDLAQVLRETLSAPLRNTGPSIFDDMRHWRKPGEKNDHHL